MKSVLIALSLSLLSSVAWAETPVKPVTQVPEAVASSRTATADVLTEQAVTTSASSVVADASAPVMTDAELNQGRQARTVSVSRTSRITNRVHATRHSRLLRD